MLRQRVFGRLSRFLEQRRYPTLLTLTAGLFLADLVIPDAIPFADEFLLALLSALFVSWKRKRGPQDEPLGPSDR